ncbi:hypothetical protein [Shimazuella kribbensis]|uniref:hypothetical protein n=1 Tax=Shimazuella kribbensis TaxID=139808 RepID=UPI0006866630|nr:hypothetical protein [Shimazuella kribbensis]
MTWLLIIFLPLFFVNWFSLFSYFRTIRTIIFQIIRYVLGLFYAWMVYYVYLADITWSASFSYFTWIVCLLWIFDAVYYYWEESELSRVQITFLIVSSVGFVAYLYLAMFYPYTLSKEKYGVAAGISIKTNIQPTNEQHIPVVPWEYAYYKMEKILGKVKDYSYYDIGTITIQKIKGKLVWVAPIEYKGFFKWRNAKQVPGYITMDAEDQRAEAKFIPSPMKYVPSGYFGENAFRLARNKYPSLVLLEASFEPDEAGKPVYVITYGRYQKYRHVTEVQGAILLDPVTGKMKKYTLNQVPAFVDQVIPSDIALERNEWFGSLKHGFWNSILGKQDVHTPTSWGSNQEMIAVFDQHTNMYWATDHTRSESGAGSMVGYSMLNTRTGKLLYYEGANSLLNGTAALNVAEKSFKEKEWHGSSPALYYIFGQYTWVIPLLDKNYVLRKIALVNARDEKVVGFGDNKQDAFNQYKYAISSDLGSDPTKPGSKATMTEKRSKIKAVYKTSTQVQFLLEGEDHIFAVEVNNNPYAVFLEVGQKVKIQYIETNQTIVPVKSILNQTLGK